MNWRKNMMPSLPEEKQMFTTKMDGKTVWVIEDGAAFTFFLSRRLLGS